jgi:hypothetical protein
VVVDCSSSSIRRRRRPAAAGVDCCLCDSFLERKAILLDYRDHISRSQRRIALVCKNESNRVVGGQGFKVVHVAVIDDVVPQDLSVAVLSLAS